MVGSKINHTRAELTQDHDFYFVTTRVGNLHALNSLWRFVLWYTCLDTPLDHKDI
jgi:hypothetical protein